MHAPDHDQHHQEQRDLQALVPFARASSLDRLLACPGGELLAALSNSSDVKSAAALESADWGTMVHHWKATGEIIQVGDRENHPRLFRKKLDQGGVRREDWWPGDAEHEIGLAVDPFSRYAENREGNREALEAWKAGFDDRWCTGTGDGCWWMFDTLCVDDLKTGKNVKFEDHVEQLRFYALGTARVMDYRGPVHATITWWPRYPVLSQPQRFGRVIEQDELRWFEKRLSQLRDATQWARNGKIDIRDYLKPGEKQCTWCPARQKCKAKEDWEQEQWESTIQTN